MVNFKFQTLALVAATASFACISAANTDPHGSWPTNNVGVNNLNYTKTDAGLNGKDLSRITLDWASANVFNGDGSFNPDRGDDFTNYKAVQSVPVLADGNVFFADTGGWVYSYKENGSLNWKVQLLDELGRPEFFVANPVLTNNQIFVAARKMHAINIHNGEENWSTIFNEERAEIFSSGPTYRLQTSQIQLVDDLVVYATSFSDEIVGDYNLYQYVHGEVIAFRQSTGQRAWIIDLVDDPFGPVIPVPNPDYPATSPFPLIETGAGIGSFGGFGVDTNRKLLFIGTNNNYDSPVSPISDSLVAINYETGTIVWHYQYLPWTNDICGVLHCPFNNDTDMDVGGHPALFKINGIDVVGCAAKDGTYRVFKRDQDNLNDVKPYFQFQIAPQAGFNLSIGAQPIIKNGIMYIAGSFYAPDLNDLNTQTSTDNIPPVFGFPDSRLQDAFLWALDLKKIADYYVSVNATVPLAPPGVTFVDLHRYVSSGNFPEEAVLWKTYIPEASIVNSSGLTLADDYIIFGDLLGGIYIYNANNGQQVTTDIPPPNTLGDPTNRAHPTYYVTVPGYQSSIQGGYGLPILGGISVSHGRIFVPFGYDYQGFFFGNGGVAAFHFPNPGNE